jgi:hypothetical protein
MQLTWSGIVDLQRSDLCVSCGSLFLGADVPLQSMSVDLDHCKLAIPSRSIKPFAYLNLLPVYHVFGEMFLGAWRAYTSFLTGSRPVIERLPEITNIVFAHVLPKTVFDHAGLNKFFFERFL